MSTHIMRFSVLPGFVVVMALVGCGTSQAPSTAKQGADQPSSSQQSDPAADAAATPGTVPTTSESTDSSPAAADVKAAKSDQHANARKPSELADSAKETASHANAKTSTAKVPDETTPSDPKPATPAAPAALPPEVEGLTRLDPKYEVWIDPKQKRVLMTGEIARQQGQLEMFACLKNTKEHESIVAVNTKAYIVNAALIALGANPGQPVQFRPEFKPAHGPEVEVTVLYTDANGKRQQARGQEWIRNIKTGKPLDQPWVFGGSGFWVDESTGEKHFMAEDGDFVCISNFHSAMLDLPVESSQASAELMFEAFTERIPPEKTPVVLVLTPKIEPKKAEKASTTDETTPKAAADADKSSESEKEKGETSKAEQEPKPESESKAESEPKPETDD